MRTLRLAALALTALMLGAPAARAEVDYSSCRSVRVIDGDTLDVECSGETIRVRLLRIDTPEHKDAGFKGARDALAALVEGEELRLEFEEPGVPARGTFGRLLAYIFVGEVFVNEEMIAGGWTKFWTKYGRGRYADVLEAAEGGSVTRGASGPPLAVASESCCRTCRKGKACGASCIAASATCRKGRGCACNASEGGD